MRSTDRDLRPGERYDAETGEIMYSADWLSDDQPQASPEGNLAHMIDVVGRPSSDEIARRRDELQQRDRARNAGRRWRR